MTDIFLNGVKVLRMEMQSSNYRGKVTRLELENGEIYIVHNWWFSAENSVIHGWSSDDVTQ
jgi:hypothetical protein